MSVATGDLSRSRWDGLLLRFPGPVPYQAAWDLQRALWEQRRALRLPDCLVLLEHEPVYTLGRHGQDRFLRAGRPEHIPVVPIDRGGQVTYHGPGQLTAYLIADLRAHDLGVKPFVHALEETVIRLMAGYAVSMLRREGLVGVWTGARPQAKLAAAGVRIAGGVSLHGIALNVAERCRPGFQGIVPCGLAGESITTMEALLGSVPLDEVAARWSAAFEEVFDLALRPLALPLPRDEDGVGECLRQVRQQARRGARKPPWLKMGLPQGRTYREVRRTLDQERLYTVCEGAHCPNRQECWSAGTATFMILGRSCTRRCRFCAVGKDAVEVAEPDEPGRLASAAGRMGLEHIVVTSVTRDDLPDGGAGQFVATIAALRSRCPGATVEVLIPDFAGDRDSLARVIAARPDVLNHNIETVPRLYRLARPQAIYRRSLAILSSARAAGLRTKSGFMVGLGESAGEIRSLLADLRAAGCQHVTIGQYLQPNRDCLPVKRYWTPAEFAGWRAAATHLGFEYVDSGALVRSSYHAAEALRGSG